MSSVEIEFALAALAAMLLPTTLAFCVLALVLGERPLRTGLWFYLGALGATLGIGVIGGLVLGGAAASGGSSPKTWVAVVDVIAALAVAFFVIRALRRPKDPQKVAAMVERMSGLASSPAIAIVGAGAALANPGGLIPIALKEISEMDPGTAGYLLLWAAFSLVSLLPLAVALLLLRVAPEPTMGWLHAARAWLELHARTVAAVILLLLAAALLRNGIAGLT
ncbi:MAG: GAP family protein [Solirubrobacterales bacterium]